MGSSLVGGSGSLLPLLVITGLLAQIDCALLSLQS